MATYKLTGSIKDKKTGRGQPDLTVEAWDKDIKDNDLLGKALTDAEGGFAITFGDDAFSDKGEDPKPDLYVKIYSGRALIHTTEEAPINDWTPEQGPLEIELKPPTTPENTVQLFITAGLDNGKPAAGVQLVVSYELPAGGTWTSQPITANANGKLTVDIPAGTTDTIDWPRVGFAFSKNDKPLRVVDKSRPDPNEGGVVINFKLARTTIPWPPEQDPNKWYIRGRVSTANGEAILANVSAAAIRLSGEISLGQVQTSNTGRYEIIYEWDNECLPDVQVTAHVQDKPIAQSAIHFAAGKSIRIDLIQNNEIYIGPTEFQQVEAQIRKCNQDLDLSEFGAKQFDYLLGKTHLAPETFTSYLVAGKLASLCDVPTEVFYGLFRAKLPTSLQGLVIQTPKVLGDALNASIRRNIIDRKFKDALNPLIAALRQLAVEGSLKNNQQLDHAGMSDLLTVAGVPTDAHANLVNRYFEHDGDGASFWESLYTDDALGVYADRVKMSLQSGALSMYHLPTIRQFKTTLGAEADIKDLALWQEQDWQTFGKSLESAPDGIAGTTKKERIHNYVDGMRRTVKRAFAHQYTTANVLRSDTFPSPVLREFLENTTDFDYANSSIPAVLDKTDITGEQRIELEKTLKGMQRLYRVAPVEQKFEVVDFLFAGGITSSRDIVLQGSTQFIHTYADLLGGTIVAMQVYNNAATVTALSTNLLAGYNEMFNASAIYAIGGGVPVSQPDTQGDLVIPSYHDLFGSQSFCECEHCSSVYSPAAYFVDLLAYLAQSTVTKRIGGENCVEIIKDGKPVCKTGLDVLFQRRADLGDIRLDCKNTNTVLPYIDLVNEIFERAVVGETEETESSKYQTNWNEAELKTNPEHILGAAYDTLATTTFPLTLPFRLWNVEAEHYLQHLDVDRWKVMETVKNIPDAAHAVFEQICFAYLGLTQIDVDILQGAPAYSGSLAAVGKMWGYTGSGWRANMSRVPVFLKRSRLSYLELRQLLQVAFVNGAGEIVIDFSDAESACDIDGAVLRYLIDEVIDTEPHAKNTFDLMQRFLRLRLKTGWSIWELSRVLNGLSITQLTIKAITQVSVIKRVADNLALDVIEVLSWWTNLDTGLDSTDPDYRSFYESVFVNPAVLNPPDPTFLIDDTNRSQLAVESTGGALISEHVSSIAAALQINETQARLLAETLLDSFGEVDDALTLTNLSQLHRMASLCRSVDIDIEDYILLERLIGADLWNGDKPFALLEFLDAIQSIQHSAFSISELSYLLLHDGAAVSRVQLPAASIADLLTAIQNAVRAVWVRYVIGNANLIEQLTTRLGDYVAQEEIDLIVNLVGQEKLRSPEDITYLEEAVSFLSLSALETAIDQGLQPDVRYQQLLILLNHYGRRVNSINVVSQLISETFALDLSVTQLILTEVVTRSNQPGDFVIDVLLEPLFIDSGKEKLAAAIDVEFQQDAFRIIEGASAMIKSEMEAFIDQHFNFLDTEEAKNKLVGDDPLVDVMERYQYVTSPLDGAEYEMTDAIFAEAFAAIRSIQKTALLVGKFQIGQTELTGLNDHAQDLKVLPLAGFPFEERQENLVGFNAWENLLNLLDLRRLFVSSDADLFSLLEKAVRPTLIDIISANMEIDELIAGGQWNEADRPLLVWLYEFAAAAGWSFPEVAYVAGAEMLNASLPDMLNMPTLVYLTEVVELATRLGTTAAQLNVWSELDVTQTDAANAKQTARARYSIEQWYDIAPALRDVLREKQRDALTAYMLHLGGFDSTVALYNHYLIDSEMSACMLTSRLKLALSSVQLFLQRCLLNLEDELVAVDLPEEWEWRKNYRVWEANRKVFLYPENYIKPELRITRSEIFDAAQSILLQNEVTIDVAEQSLLRYLEGLDEVSNMEVVGSYHEVSLAEDGLDATDRMHVVARTRGIPHKYFYRVRDGRAWSPWEEIDADIGTDQVLPIVVNRRLYLFWPAFFEKQIAGVDVLNKPGMKDAKDAYIASSENYNSYLEYLYGNHFQLDFEVYVVLGGEETPNGLGYIPIYGEDFSDEIISYAEDNGYDIDDLATFLAFLDNINGTLSNSSYSSLEACAENILDKTLEETIILLVDVTDAQSWDDYQASTRESLDGKFQETFNYFEIKLSVSEYKNGNWMPSRSSENYIESDQKISAVALLDGNQIPVTPGDFHFYATIEDDVVTIECLQTLRYTDGNYAYPYIEGDFQYNVLSKEILTFDYKDDRRGFPIESPTGTDVSGNGFVENAERIFEIPWVPNDWHFTTHHTLLDRTPGTFRVPIQHQFEQFSAFNDFFFGDDKYSFLVSYQANSADSNQPSPGIGNFPDLEDYINIETPGFGVYEDLLIPAGSARTAIGGSLLPTVAPQTGNYQLLGIAGTGTSEKTGSAEDFDLSQATAVSQYYDYALVPNKYHFTSFYHPLVGELIKKVNGDGPSAALSRETQNISEKYFISRYQPTDEVADEYPIRNFSFSDIDANGFYNYELFLHLPLLIAMRLSKNQQFADAQRWFHTIFDPTSHSSDKGAQRFWQFKPFFDMYAKTSGHPFDSIYDMLTALAVDSDTEDAETLALKKLTEQQIKVWRANPFDPHAIAALRPVAYMKTVVSEYLNNLIAWGDYLYEQFTIESITEATLYYILAYQILGDRPVALPELDISARSYNELGKLDEFSNAEAQLENLINLLPSSITGGATIAPLYFCIPNNPTLLQLWDTVEDRLFKIRHCMTIEGVVQQLPLFQPPINPMLLVEARAAGISIGSALVSLATPAPHYRFVYLMQKAVEYCQVVKGLGSQLLAAYEKQDGEALGLLRAEHEDSLLRASTELRNLQVDEARENLSSMEKSKLLVEERIEYYSSIEKRSEKEKEATKNLDNSERQRIIAGNSSVAASIAAAIPNFTFKVESGTDGPLPTVNTGQDIQFGGSNIASILNSISSGHANASARYNAASNKNLTDASYDRRWDDWKLQERLAKKELKQVEKQIITAEIRLALSEKERDNNAIQLEQSREVRDFLSAKFTNKELYGWMVSQTSAIYFQSYKLAYDLAKRCEKAYQRESGEYSSTYIAYGYFDSMKKGLLSGERLHHDLQRMEFDYLNTNRREYELTRHVSLAQLDPSALIALRETGACFISLPEMLFDFDYPGHYFRRIKTVSLTIPSITGPYTNLSSTLTLQSDKVRIVAKKDAGETDSANLQFNLASVKSIATSSGQSDSGVFQLDFRDERYLPFEGAGVISEWKLALNDPQLAQFDYNTISDVIMHINYTARDGGETYRTTVETGLLSMINDYFGSGKNLQQLISVKQTMADEWARLANTTGDENYLLSLNLGLDDFPYYLKSRGIAITKLSLLLGGEVNTYGWDEAALPDIADSGGNKPYKSSFSDDPVLKLAAASFDIELPVENNEPSITVDLPKQLVGEAGSTVTDIFIIFDYRISAAN